MASVAEEISRACAELGLRVERDFLAPCGHGMYVHAAVYLPDLGGKKGMLVVTSDDQIRLCERHLAKEGYGYSIFGDTSAQDFDQDFDLDNYIELFIDWGWTGKPEDRPQWMGQPVPERLKNILENSRDEESIVQAARTVARRYWEDPQASASIGNLLKSKHIKGELLKDCIHALASVWIRRGSIERQLYDQLSSTEIRPKLDPLLSAWQLIEPSPRPPDEELIRSALGPVPDCWDAIRTLGHAKSQIVADFFAKHLSAKDWTMRRACAEAVRHQPSEYGFEARLIGLLNDPEPVVQRAACDSLCSMKASQANHVICALLKSADTETRKKAISCLGVLWLDSNWNALLKMSQTGADSGVRAEASYALRPRVNNGNWREVIEPWSNDTLARHRIWACEILGEYGSTVEAQRLEDFRQDKDGHVRKAAEMATKRILQRDK